MSLCGDSFLIGGSNILGPSGGSTYFQYFKRDYSGIPTPHNTVTFKFTLWILDWYTSDFVRFYIAGYTADYYFHTSYMQSSSTCGDQNRNDLPGVRFEGKAPHTGSTMSLIFYSGSSRDSKSASFGIRDITFTFDQITPAPSTISSCIRSPTYYPYGNLCSCVAGQYETPTTSGNCVACDSNCKTCNGGTSSNCLSCVDGKYWSANQCLTCDNSCLTCNGAGSTKCTSCPAGTYLSSGQCLTCDGTCKTCVDTSTKCTSCNPGRYQSGNTCPQCDNSCATCSAGTTSSCLTCASGRFMISNNTCVTTCDSPLTQTFGSDGTTKFCESPCPSDLSKFIYWDKSCQTTCASPLTQATNGPLKLCTYKCNSNEYLFWNASCPTKCPLPYKIEVRFQKNFCTFPCTSSQYLFANGTCFDACDYPLVQTNGDAGQKYCVYPCNSNQYLFWDQTCVESCPAPYQIKISGDLRYCTFPCLDNQYYYWNGSCSDVACQAPLTLRQEGTTTKRNFCDLDCPSDQYLMWYGDCGTNCDAPFRNATANGINVCKAPCDSAFPIYFEDLTACGKDCISPRVLNNSGMYPVCDKAPVKDQGGALIYFLMNAPQVPEYSLLVATPNMKFLQYLDVDLPPRLQKLAGSKGHYMFSPRFGLSAPSSVYPKENRLLLAEVFEKSGLSTSFLVNFWDGLLTMAIVLGITLVLTIFENFLQKSKMKVFHGIIERLMVMGGFNYLFLIYSCSLGEIIMYTYIEVTNSNGFTISLAIGIILTVLIIPYLYLIYFVVKKATQMGAYDLKNENADKYKKFSIRWRACQIFVRGMKHETWARRLFYLIYTARTTVQMLLAVFLYSIPIAQVLLQILLNIGMIVFMILKKPLQKRVNHIQIILFESITLLLNFFTFIVVIMGNAGNNETDFAVILGDIIVIGTDVLNILVMIFIAIKVRLEVLSILKVLKEYPNHNKAIWVNLLGVLAQQTGMGFEEVIEESSIPGTANKYIGLLLKSKSLAKEKAELLKSRSQIYPEDVSRNPINDTEPMIKKTEISSYQTPGAESGIMDANNSTSQHQPKLQARVKNVISHISLKKQGTENIATLNLSPTFSIDLSDNSPTVKDHTLLLNHQGTLESPPKTREEGVFFFPETATSKPSSRPTSNYDEKRLLTLSPVLPPVKEAKEDTIIVEKKPLRIADEVGLDDYLKSFGLMSEDTNKASTTVGRKNLSRSPTLKSKKK